MAPFITPWSVSPRAGWPISAARAAIASILQAPSSSEYSLWAWRWTADGLLTGRGDHAKQARWTDPIPRVFRAISVRICERLARLGGSAGADPGAAARVGPDFGGDPILFGLGRILRFALAAVELPGRGQDLVRAAGAAGGIDRGVVAPRLAHHDVGGDRVRAAEPA